MSLEWLPVAAFFLAFLSGVVFTWLSRALALRIGFVSHPNPIVPQHTKPIAYLGGAGIVAGGAAVIVLLGYLGHLESTCWTIVRLGGCAFLYLLLGLVDDLVRLAPLPKFLVQAGLAVIAVLAATAYSFTGLWLIDMGLSTLVVLILVNAFNLIDVCDGLLAGLSVIVFVALSRTNPQFSLVALVVAGSCAGFLVFNFPPASIFLGDAGSHVLGFLAAAMTLTGGEATEATSYWMSLFLVLAIPLYELGFLIMIRSKKGIPWFMASPDHFSLRLQAAGLTRPQTIGVSWLAAAGFVGIAWVYSWTSIYGRLALFALATVMLATTTVVLTRWEVDKSK